MTPKTKDSLIALTICLLLILGYWAYGSLGIMGWALLTPEPLAPLDKSLEIEMENLLKQLEELESLDKILIIEGNSLVSISSVYYPKAYTLATLTSKDLLYKIIKCESNFNAKVCNSEFGCRAGMGLCQLIPSTVKYCEKKLGKKIDPFDPEDNYECGLWLLENEGSYHWGTKDTDWGSFKCWNNS